MKITFTCKITMTDEFEDSEVKQIYPVESVVKEIKEDLKDGMSEKGTVDISDYSITVS